MPQSMFISFQVVTTVTAAPLTGTPPDNHMCLAVFTTLCCFWPLGILAIIKSSEVGLRLSNKYALLKCPNIPNINLQFPNGSLLFGMFGPFGKGDFVQYMLLVLKEPMVVDKKTVMC